MSAATVTERLCRGCDGPLPPRKRSSGKPRTRCSERCRKSQYDGQCVDCGARTNGYDGPGKASKRCVPCGTAKQSAETLWTRERIVQAIREWAATYGTAPRAVDWNVAHSAATAEMRARYRAFDCPPATTVQSRFGSWNAAIAAAGFEPRLPGRYERRAA